MHTTHMDMSLLAAAGYARAVNKWWVMVCVVEHLSQRVLHQICTETSGSLVPCMMLPHHACHHACQCVLDAAVKRSQHLHESLLKQSKAYS